MYLNKAPDEPPRRPCIRDYADLLRDHLPEPLVKLTSLPELERRCHEIVAEHPRFREEAPLLLAGEQRRRRRFAGLQLTPDPLAAHQHHA